MPGSIFLDNYYAMRFVFLLTRHWTDLPAYKLGIIDEHGHVLMKRKELKTEDQKEAFTRFHMLVFNIKRMLEKLPLGKTTIARYAAALRLIKEHVGSELTEKDILTTQFVGYVIENKLFDESVAKIHGLDIIDILENTKYINEDMGSAGCTTGGVDMVDGQLKKPEEKDEFFAGHKVFKVDNEAFDKSRLGKTRYARYRTYVGEDDVGQKVREYGRKNPGKGIILKNHRNGAMIFLKRKHPSKD